MIKSKEDARFSAGTGEPVAWVVLTNDDDFIRIWWRDKVLAEAWSAKHNRPLIPLYAAPLPAASILALGVPGEPQTPVLTEAMIEALAASLKAWDSYGGFDSRETIAIKGNAMAEAIRAALTLSRPPEAGK